MKSRVGISLWEVAWIVTGTAAAIKERGRCAMYDSCGTVGWAGSSVPCVDNSIARKAPQDFQDSLRQICGPAFQVTDTVCCSRSQLDTLAENFATPELILGTCPSCLNNFRNFFCTFTCSPDQSLFLDVVRSRDISKGKQGLAVKEVAFSVDPEYGTQFFDSCKNVKFGATNGYALDVLGPGARNYKEWFRFLGKESPGLGSPFQISFPDISSPTPAPPGEPQQPFPLPGNATVPLNAGALSCQAPELYARCSCLDCPEVCTTLEPVDPPTNASNCKVGKMDCFSFFLVIAYAIGLISFIAGAAIAEGWRRWRSEPQANVRKTRGWNSDFGSRVSSDGFRYDRLPMEDPSAPSGEESESNRSLSRSPGLAPQRVVPVNSTQRSTVYNRPPSGSLGHESSSSGRQRNTSDLGPAGAYYAQPKAYPVNTYISTGFYRLGIFCAKRAYLTIVIGLVICGLLNAGWVKFEVEKNPVRLWVEKDSSTAKQKQKFDEAFGPFYRTQQILITVDGGDERWKPVNESVPTWERLQWLEKVEQDIRALKTEEGIGLTDVCFSPSTHPVIPGDDEACVVQSVLGFFGGSVEGVGEKGWKERLDGCANMPGDVDCLAPSGAPLIPKLVMGDIPVDDEGRLIASDARALIVTFILNNSLDPEQIEKAEAWENVLKNYLEELREVKAKEMDLAIAFSTEISLEEELNKSSNTDIPVVVLSYVIMFIYVSFSLGGTGGAILKACYYGVRALLPSRGDARGRNRSGSITRSLVESVTGFRGKWLRRRLLVESKITLGLWGIVIVLLSVSTSVAVFSFIGVKVTLIIAEVIPFLVLAIGVDNVFILVHELERQNAKAYGAIARQGIVPTAMDGEEDDDELEGLPSPEERVARALARMGPSILLGAACETIAFSLGVLVGMPAVRNFAIYAAGAVAINTFLQITVFIAAMTLDLKRIEANRLDVVPFLKLQPLTPAETLASSGDSVLTWIIKNVYAPALLTKQVKYFVLAIFSGIFILSWIGSRHITLGLDQRLPLPQDSYLVDYFDAVQTYLDVGPPVYFVVEGVNTTSREGQQSLCGRFSTCDELSVANVLEAERKRPESSFIVEPPAVWIDDFLQWLNPAIDTCCRIKKKFPDQFCTPRDSPFTCKPCYEDREPGWNITMEGLPIGEEFSAFVRQWLISPTDADCPLGGRASYSTAIKLSNEGDVALSHFRTYHTPLKTQEDFINAMAASSRIAEELSEQVGSNVFAYSLFYVFFDQYSYILSITREVIAFALFSILVVSTILLGSWRTSAVICLTVLMTVVNILGIMGVWGVSLNGVSLVNLVISIGIAFEFCCHVGRAFMGALGGGLPFNHPSADRDRTERAYIALVDVGSSVFSGITLTKLVGIAILSLTKSQLLQVYYVRMWLALIVSGALHGLVFLPIALSFQGSQGFSIEHDDEDWMSREINSRYDAESRPLFAEDEEESDAESIEGY